MIWKKNIGGSSYEHPSKVIKDYDGNIVVIGSTDSNDKDFTSEIAGDREFILKIDNMGNILWFKKFEIVNSSLNGINCDKNNNYYIVGSTRSNIDNSEGINYGGYDAIVLKYNMDGEHIWTKKIGGSNDEYYSDLEIIDSKLFVVGMSKSNDFDFANKNLGETDGILAKYDLDGNMEWCKNYGGSERDNIETIVASPDGTGISFSLYCSSLDVDYGLGNMEGPTNLAILKTDLEGTISWSKRVTTGGDGFFYKIIATSDNGFILAGRTVGTKYDVDGRQYIDDFDGLIVKMKDDNSFITESVNKIPNSWTNGPVKVQIYFCLDYHT